MAEPEKIRAIFIARLPQDGRPTGELNLFAENERGNQRFVTSLVEASAGAAKQAAAHDVIQVDDELLEAVERAGVTIQQELELEQYHYDPTVIHTPPFWAR